MLKLNRQYTLPKVYALENLLRNTNYQILLDNGQRIYGPIESSGILPPPKGTEIFVGNLPPDLYEDELIPLFSQKGPIYNIRLMVDFFGKNRGYGFISYFCTEDAYTAVIELNKHRVRRSTQLAVSMSVDNRRLFIGNIPRYMNLGEIQSCLENFVEGIVQVILYREPYNEKLNRGFVFAEFRSHRLAAIARRQLSPGNLVIGEQPIFVDWADPLPVVNPEIMKRVTKLYLSNIPTYINSEHLRNIILDLVPSEHVVKVHKMSNFAFLHFDERKVAEEAFRKLMGFCIGANMVSVEWARPIEYSKNYRDGKPPQNFCKSVPPSLRRMVREEREKRRPRRKSNHSYSTDESGTSSDTTNVFENSNLTMVI